jgi:ubiquinone/menaquinone biosynthesis C-methylase UbiE
VKDRLAVSRAGVAGLCLMRLAPSGSPAEIASAVEALGACLEEVPSEIADSPPEVDAVTGYREWAETYDAPGNPLIALEEPAVARLLERLPPGVAVDIASGTGRHALRLAQLGHRVLAVDLSPDMLRQLERLGSLGRAVGEMTALPVADAAVDAVVCSLALTHLPVLEPAVAEIARVLRPGGRAVLSDIHPLVAATGGMAVYVTAGGDQRFVRNHVHWPSRYLSAFAAVGLLVRQCVEPRFGKETGVPHFIASAPPQVDAAARTAFAGLPGALVWEVERAG